MATTRDKKLDANRDPITGAPGAHPVGTGVGAALGGMAAGAAAGTVAAGPIGTLVGSAAGAIAGGLAGKAVAEHFDPTIEDAYWRENFQRESYYQSGMTYDDYAPAYRTGWEARMKHRDRRFEDVESDLSRSYEGIRGKSRLGWEHGKHAARAAWDRVERAIPGDWDKDGK
jgi:phage tail tape-measure protein